MQRSRAAKMLRAIHKMELLRDESLGRRRRISDEEQGDVPSTDWVESMLRYGGSSQPTDAIAELEEEDSLNLRRSKSSLESPEEPLLAPRLQDKGRKQKFSMSDICSYSDFAQAKEMIMGNWVNLMLLALPFAIISHFLKWNANVVFLFNLIAIVPLALILGEVTEDLALRCGDVWGGLINATFGNVVEMILSIVLLNKGLISVVSSSLVGSILSNLLLVIGCCFFVGGLNYKSQKFSSGASKANTSLLFMSCIAMLLPSMISYSFDGPAAEEKVKVRNTSHCIAIMLTITYVCYLYFQLVTHNYVFSSAPVVEAAASSHGHAPRHRDADSSAASKGKLEIESPSYSLGGALVLMTLTTGIVAFCSEFLSNSIEEVSKDSGLSLSFIGIIILPIAGNACEHITAVLVAAKDKMDLAIAVGVGSSIQIAIFVFPFVVLVGWAIDVDFTMRLNSFDMMVVCVSVILSALVTIDGQSHWFTGLMLIATYVLIAVAYFFF
mmetsp:Transcript_9836/g.25120  ORF Transcript_9836/g.25120 Transcript_9836/m.25120 type:complete len:496 (-) Transcript_9836:82-1569(-)